MSARLRNEEGWAVMTALMLTLIVLSFGLAAMAFTDSETHASGTERQRESSIDLAEGVLSEQSYMLQAYWPGTSSRAYSTACTSSGGPSAYCPAPTGVATSYSGGDYARGYAWTSTVYDDSGSLASYYSDSLASQSGVQHWDANGNGQLWVRSSAIVGGHTRTIVARVKAQSQSETVPTAALVAGHFSTSNNGNKQIVDTKGNAGQPVAVDLRCSDITQSSCLSLGGSVPAPPATPSGKAATQVSPWTVSGGYAGGPFLSAAALGRMRQTAQTLGTYYSSGCPSNPSGAVVFIENGNCSYNNSAGTCCNSSSVPGLVIVNNGTLSLNGNINFWGVVYCVNAQGSSGDVISLGGTASIEGAAAVDGNGGISAGASGVNIQYQSGASSAVRSYGTVGIVQNTWRELT